MKSWTAVLIALVSLAVSVSSYVLKPVPVPVPVPEPGGDEIRAREFVLLDKAGSVRAKLGMIEGTPSLLLLDEKGKVRTALKAGSNHSSLSLGGPGGRERIALGAYSLGTPMEVSALTLVDAAGTRRIDLKTGGIFSVLEMIYKNGEKGATILTEGSSSQIGLTNQHGVRVWSTP